MISDTTQDIELWQLKSSLTSTNANLTTTAALAGLANINSLAVINLVNQKIWILSFRSRWDLIYQVMFIQILALIGSL